MTDDASNYNATLELFESNLLAGRGNKTAVIDCRGEHSYQEISVQVNKFTSALRDTGIPPGQRVLICLLDTVEFPISFLGTIKSGNVAVPVNTLLTTNDYDYILNDSCAPILIVSSELLAQFEPLLEDATYLKHIWVVGENNTCYQSLRTVLEPQKQEVKTAVTKADDAALWLYTSGTTGKPKAAMHSHSDLLDTFTCYAEPILRLNEQDVVFSAAKLFFAYGLGNALTFPFVVGATTVLLDQRPTPESVVATIRTYKPSVFFGVPTLYAMMLNAEVLPPGDNSLRLCVSAGEALPENVLQRWLDKTGLHILDGIGSTEMLHIYISNRENALKPGTSGKAVDGYELKILDETEKPVEPGQVGDLYVRGPTQALGYWNQREKTQQTFIGPWTRSGDKYYQDDEGYFVFAGRGDDLLKVGGVYVSPTEVENVLMTHPAVAEAAVVGTRDDDVLIKPKGYVTLMDTYTPDDTLANELIEFVRSQLAEYKRPRWIEFLDDLPKTATGKIQRFKLRE